MLSGFRKKTQDTHDNNNNSHQKPSRRGLGLARLCLSLLSTSLFPPLAAGLGSGHRALRYSAPAPLLPWGATTPPPPHPPTGRLGRAAPAGRPGPAVLRGNLARGTQLEGNFGILQETIVGEEGVGCCVQFLYFPSERSVLGRRTPFCSISPSTLTPPHPPPDSGGERCGGGEGLGAPPRPGLLFRICLFHFCPCLPGLPALPGQLTLRPNGGTRVRRLQHGPHK